MEKLAYYSKWTLRITIALAAVYDLFVFHPVGLAGGAAVFASTYFIDYINKGKFKIADSIISMYCIFCVFALVLGVMLNFYDFIPWWDMLMHVFSGLLLGIAGNILLNSLNQGKKTVNLLRFLFVVGIACTGGIIWEIYEFTVDALLGLDTQIVELTGVADTMGDLITDFIGGIIAGILCVVTEDR